MSGLGPLKYNEFLRRLAKHGVEERAKGGKGSERILIRPEHPGSNKGPQYPIKHHGSGTTLGVGTIRAALRRFGINPNDL
ncbi:MAG: type II toxin-antitoxin system HicA family toxin [Nitrospinae bacterium]|nr:type II toxin-antitoxin system HicA family toxin [Nitrospinota bacterium]